MARLFEVSLSGYYDWLKRGISKRKQHHNRCELLVKSAHIDTEQSYGHERLNQHLPNQGHNISLYMVRQIKQEHGIYCKRHKRFKTTTDSNHNKPVYPNLLEQQFDVAAPNIEKILAEQCSSGQRYYLHLDQWRLGVLVSSQRLVQQRNCGICVK